MDTPFLRTPFNYDRNKASDESGLSCGEPTRTKQSFKEECDINNIMRKFGVTGLVPTNVHAPMHGDFTNAMTFQESLDAMIAAEQSFMKMPSNVRKRFHNDPAEFVDFCSDEANRDEMKKMGLLVPEAFQQNLPGVPSTPAPTTPETPPK